MLLLKFAFNTILIRAKGAGGKSLGVLCALCVFFFRSHTEPIPFFSHDRLAICVYLTKSRFLQSANKIVTGDQLHAVDDMRPFLVRRTGTVRLADNQELAARFQNAMDAEKGIFIEK